MSSFPCLKSPPRAVLALGVLLLSSLAAMAQPATNVAATVLPDTIVTATREETPIDQVPNAVTVIDRPTIEQRQYRSLSDILNDVPGLSVTTNGGFGKGSSVFIRGANANGTLVLIDGLRANDPSASGSTFNFSHLLAETIDRVEVVRGPLSTLYGADAYGGVINVITRKGQGAPSGFATIEGGSFNTLASAAGFQGQVGKFDFNVGASSLNSDGGDVAPRRFRAPSVAAENDAYRNLTFNARLGAAVTENFDVSLFARYVATKSQYDNLQIEDPNSRERTSQFYGRVVGELYLWDGKWKQTFGLGYVRIERHDSDDPDPVNPFPFTLRTENIGRRLKADWQNDIEFSKIYRVSFGIEAEKDWQDSNNDGFRVGSHVGTVGAYMQHHLTLFDSLFLTAAARLDRNSSFGTHPTFSFGAAYLIRATDTKLKASIGSAYRAPDLFQLFGSIPPFFTGNPILKPEKSLGFDAGFEQSIADRRVNFGSTFFWNDIKNLIDSDAFFTTVVNVGRARTYGLESFIAMRPTEWLQLRLNHTWTHTQNLITHQPLARRPKHSINFNATVEPLDKLTLGLTVAWKGAQRDVDPVSFGPTTNRSYTLAALTASYKVLQSVELYGRVENLFDTNQEDPLGFAHPGLAGYAGVRVKY
ncbi:MAG: TonB-dependent receptor [Rhodospirillales bacterium]